MDPVSNHLRDPLMETAIANVRSGAIDDMASQIDGSSTNVSKRIVGPRKDDPEKVEHLYNKIDAINLLCSPVDDVGNYLDAISTNDDSTISNGIELPLSEAFATQHHRKRATIMTNPQLIGDFAAAQQLTKLSDSSILVRENVIASQADEIRWREQVLSKKSESEFRGRKIELPRFF